jgi:hypothetical protein
MKRFLHLPSKWGWQCNSNWQGVGKSFNITIPTQNHLVVQGMKYNPELCQIEVWGYTTGEKYIDTEYNERHRSPKYVPPDISRPESQEGTGR